jgi:hypothetical protein
VKAVITIDLNVACAEEAQQVLFDLCDGIKQRGLAGACAFEIETPDGKVTDRCFLAEGKVIA